MLFFLMNEASWEHSILPSHNPGMISLTLVILTFRNIKKSQWNATHFASSALDLKDNICLCIDGRAEYLSIRTTSLGTMMAYVPIHDFNHKLFIDDVPQKVPYRVDKEIIQVTIDGMPVEIFIVKRTVIHSRVVIMNDSY